MRSHLSVLSLLLSLLAAHVRALTFNVNVRQRAAAVLAARANGQNAVPVANTHNSEYIANITLGGRQIPVLLDTGSSDLWVTGSVPNAKDVGKSVSLSYAVGKAAGDVYTATLEFANYTVQDQAFLLVQDTSSFSVDIKSQGYEGLIGLGPNTGSVIRDKLDSASGDSVLDRIFSQNTTSSNFLTILLNREGDPSSASTGQLTVSEVLPQYSNITSMPKLPVTKVHKLTDEDQHWQVLTDVNGVLGPDGQPIQVDSIVPSAPDGQLVVVFDSGFTLPQVPRAMADAIYGRVQGAEYNTASEVWTIPCDQLIPLTFKFGGVEYPIHPLDVSSSDFNMVNSLGNPVCVGTFQPITSAFSLLGEYDIILGMAFLRNTYTLLDYGNFMENTASDRGDPYVQLLPVTDVNQAHKDFVQVRLNGVDTTGDSSHALLPADQMQHSPISEAEKKKAYEEMILSRWPYIFVGCLLFVLLVAGLITWRCCVRRRKKREAKMANVRLPDTGSNAPRSPGAQAISFSRLEDGALPDNMEMRESKGYDYRSDYRPSFASSRTRV
ncbi:acid protease [Trametes coccinea BRFM310]|uniref:Acid protease n=1 Tax=Trametes coccinea (strain BRFM310) TaxID=1353009 RepID=A0A1Y2J267_TRAC3|nr:acid protease [Trametes coccinea BRFM310]